MTFFVSPAVLRSAFVAERLHFLFWVTKVAQLFPCAAAEICSFLSCTTLRRFGLPFAWAKETKLRSIFVSAKWIYFL